MKLRDRLRRLLPASGSLAAEAERLAARRQERLERLRRGSIWLGAVIVFGLMLGMMIGRLLEPASELATARPAVVRLLHVQVQQSEQSLRLQLLLERAVPYRRLEQAGALGLLLENVQLSGESRHGRIQQHGQGLAWRLRNRGADLQVLLVGPGQSLQVREHGQQLEAGWQLSLDVSLAADADPAAASTDERAGD